MAQHAFILRAVVFAERCGENLIGTTPDQFTLAAAAAAFHQRLIHDHIFAAAVFEEKNEIRQAIEQRLAREGFGELREKFALQLGWRHAFGPLCRNSSLHSAVGQDGDDGCCQNKAVQSGQPGQPCAK